MILFTTEEAGRPGAIRLRQSFFLNQNADAAVVEIQSHFSSISRLKISFDDTYIFSTGEDGTVIIYQLQLDREIKIKLDKDGMGIHAEANLQ
jgi:WD40 repeat protein